MERVEHDRRVERMRRRVNSDGELRETMRPRAGPADLRNLSLNRETDTRELMRPRPGPSDLRYSNLQPNKDLRQIMNPKPVRSMETERSDLENAIIAKTRDLESSLKAKDRTIRRLLSQMNGGELSSEDSSAEESEAEPSEDEIPSVDEVELTNVNNADDETGVGTPVPGPSVSTQIPGPSVSIPGTQETSVGTPVPDPSVGTQIPGPSVSSPGREKQSKMKPSPIKYPGCNERSHSGDDVPLKKLTTPKRSRPIIKTDLRKKLKKVPVFSKTKLHNDKGPVQSRMNRDLPGPWKTGSTSDCGTEHRNRPFIANSDCARYEVGSSRSWSNCSLAGRGQAASSMRRWALGSSARRIASKTMRKSWINVLAAPPAGATSSRPARERRASSGSRPHRRSASSGWRSWSPPSSWPTAP